MTEPSTGKGQRELGISFLLTLAFCILELIGGIVSGSLALRADAVHMLADMGALALAFFAGWMTQKAPTRKLTFGFYRIEILAALVNGAALFAVAILIVLEAFRRIQQTVPIQTPLMMAVASAGLIVNIINALLLSRSCKENLNIKAAFFHVLSDTLSSVATLIAGGVIMTTGWTQADPLISCLIAILIVTGAVKLLREGVEVLLEAVPAHIDLEILEKKILSVSGVTAIHDLHVWSITCGRESLSAHLAVLPEHDSHLILDDVNAMLDKEFGIQHTTLQIEPATRSAGKIPH